MQIIPLQPVPSQTVAVLLADQNCQIKCYQKSTGMFLDLYVDDALIIGGVICLNLNRIVRSLYLGFIGDLAFIDSTGSADPIYTGLGDRFNLAYLEVSELPPGQG
jgi:hypothetical protein